MSSSARKLATYDDLAGYPEDVRVEILAGEIHVQPRPLPRHGRAQRVIGGLIGSRFDDEEGQWWILPEVDVRFSPTDIVSPDYAGWRRARLPDPWDMRPIEVVPDWVCEILSPSNEKFDRVYKYELYARHGVPYYWLINTRERVLEAYALEGGRWVGIGNYDDRAVARIAPFEALELPVGRLFPPVTH